MNKSCISLGRVKNRKQDLQDVYCPFCSKVIYFTQRKSRTCTYTYLWNRLCLAPSRVLLSYLLGMGSSISGGVSVSAVPGKQQGCSHHVLLLLPFFFCFNEICSTLTDFKGKTSCLLQVSKKLGLKHVCTNRVNYGLKWESYSQPTLKQHCCPETAGAQDGLAR